MAGLPSPTQVSGQNYGLYEAWYSHVDPQNLGSIGALDAANFLKKSGLSSAVLGKIWDLSDPYGKGYLDKNGLFVALKLVSLAQNAIEVNMSNIMLETPPPNMGELPPVKSVVGSLSSSKSLGALSMSSPPLGKVPVGDWTMSPEEKVKYDALFDSLGPLDEKLPGFKVKEVLVNSKLPLETLGKIWDLSDMDRDGALSRHEFSVAMHLVYRVLDSYPLPATLPPELSPSSGDSTTKRRGSSLAGGVPVLSAAAVNSPDLLKGTATVPAAPVAVAWVVGAADKAKYEALFYQADMDKDGFVSGLEIKDTFLQTGLPQPVLAHIWNLCDIGQTGKLNVEQFALAMWLVQQKVQGLELPTVLQPEMVPPSLRVKEENSQVVSNSAELELLAKEIENLILERRTLETEIAQKEADIRIKSAEVRNLQGELDTLTATLKQLENQKKEAQKRLDDLEAQRAVLDQDLRSIEQQIEDQDTQVRTLRQQAEEQEQSLKSQEAEVNARKQELEDLRNEEVSVEQQVQAARTQLDKLKSSVQNTQQAITQVKSRMSTLREEQQQIAETLNAYEEVLSSGDPSQLTDSMLDVINTSVSQTDVFPSPTSEAKSKATISGFDGGSYHNDPFSSLNGPGRVSGPSNGADPFGDSTFASSAVSFGAGKDPFASSAFGSTTTSSNDPFASAFGQPKIAAFGSFGTAKTADADPFGSDPFNAPAATSQRGESPTPALPPKKAKQPPPRPAPPKASTKAPQRPAPPVAKGDPFAPGNDPFAAPAPPAPAAAAVSNKDPFGGGGFADFANFDSIFSSSTTTTSTNSSAAWDTVPSNHNEQKQQQQHQHRYAALDFTEDPFKDVSITDPFASNGDDPFAFSTAPNSSKKKSSDHFDAFSADVKDPFASIDANFNVAPKDSWNRNGNHADPFSSGGKTSVWGEGLKIPPPQLSMNKSPTSPVKSSKSSKAGKDSKMNEMQQLAWAAAESVRLEQERRRRAELQEKADLELAIALSKSEAEHVNDRLV